MWPALKSELYSLELLREMWRAEYIPPWLPGAFYEKTSLGDVKFFSSGKREDCGGETTC